MSERIFLQGEAGQLEIFVDTPARIQGIALITHPHPLMGGNPQHKVPQLMCEVLLSKHYLVWRPSFRGSGQSTGTHDNGEGEHRDIAFIAQQLQQCYPHLPFIAGGFSFGSYVWVKSFHRLDITQQPKKLILAGLPCGTVRGLVDYQTPDIDADILLIHGEQDDICALQDVIDWAAPQKHPITILPKANHFFTGYLKPLRLVLERYIQT